MRLEPDDIRELRPVIAAVVRTVLDEIEAQNASLGDRLAFSESEAAAMLGVPRHVLRDARLRGEITARKIGKEYRYARASLLLFVEECER